MISFYLSFSVLFFSYPRIRWVTRIVRNILRFQHRRPRTLFSLFFLGVAIILYCLTKPTSVAVDGARSRITELPTELQVQILEHSSLPDLDMLGATNSFYRALVHQHVLQRVSKLFSFFEIDPIPMLNILSRTRSVVSGSAALVVLNPWSFTPNDIDIYVPPTNSALLVHLLKTNFGYVSDKVAYGYPAFSGITAIHTLKKGIHSVQVMVTSSDNPVDAIFHFHSTLVMNFVSADVVYSAYPTLTSQRRGLKNQYELARNGQSDEAVQTCMDKYKERGYDVADDLSGWPDFDYMCASDGSNPNLDRYLDDRHAYFHLFRPAPAGIIPNRVPSVGVDRSVWSLVGHATPLINAL